MEINFIGFSSEELKEISTMLYEVASHYRYNLKEIDKSQNALAYAEKCEEMLTTMTEYEIPAQKLWERGEII